MSDDEEDSETEDTDGDGFLRQIDIEDIIGLDDETFHFNSYRQVQSPDSHDSGIQVEYVRPSKPVKRTGKRWEPPPPPQPREEEAPRRKLPPGWERHEG